MLTLKLKNYRRFLEMEPLIFPRGLTIVTGSNGAGKTTLVESISYALFGPKRGASATSVRPDNATGDVEAQCTLSIDGQEVVIRRWQDRAELRIDGTVHVAARAASVQEINRRLAQLLGGLSRERFEEIYVAAQGQTAGLLVAKPKYRTEILDAVLQIDVLRDACAIQGQVRDEYLATAKAKAEVVAEQLALSVVQRAPLVDLRSARAPEKRRAYLRRFVSEAAKATACLRQTAQEVQATLAGASMEEVRARGADEEQRDMVDAAEQSMRCYEQRRERHEGYTAVIVRAEALRDKASADMQQVQTRIDALGDPMTALRQVEQDRDAAYKRYTGLQVDPTVEDRRLWLRDKEALDTHEQETISALRLSSRDDDATPCPTCGQPLDAAMLAQRMDGLRAWMADKLPQRRQILDQQDTLLNDHRLQWGERKSVAERCWHEAVEVVARQQTNVEKLKECQTQRAHIERERYAYATEANNLREKQASIDYDAAQHKQTDERLRETRLHKEETAVALRDAEEKVSAFRVDVKRALDVVDRGAAALAQLRNVVDEYDRHEQLAGLLTGFLDQYRTRNTAAIERRAGELIAEAVTDGSILGLRFERNGELYYHDGAHEPQPVTRLSGGEKAVVGICLRIALAEQALRVSHVGKLRFLILDEVLGALDEERLEAIQRVFQNVQQQSIFDHIIVITHQDAVKQNWQGAGLEVRKVDGRSSEAAFSVTA